MVDFSIRRFVVVQAVFVAVLAVGTIGFHALLDDGWVASFYRAVVTTTLTGLASAPDTAAAQLFSVALLLAGVAIFLYLASTVVEMIAQGVVGGAFVERRQKRRIEMLQDHVIICGFGRVGSSVAADVATAGRAVVVLDVSEAAGERAAEIAGVEFIHGNGAEDEDLRRAGIGRAYALVACADSDEKNVFITLSARAQRPDLVIVARASAHGAGAKLLRAGADRVVEPYVMAGRTMANQVVKPHVAALLELAGDSQTSGLRFEELLVTEGCDGCGKTLRELDLRGRTGASIVAVRRHDGELVGSPGADEVLHADDILVAVGSADQIGQLERLLAPRGLGNG